MKYHLILLILCGVLALPISAQRTFRLEHPALTVSLPPANQATGRAVIVCPGGGYHFRAEGHEGRDWAPYFNRQGIAFILLHYRMPENGQVGLPLQDAEAAIRLVRDSASVWNLRPDQIGIVGFSAGGHLASMLATHPDPTCRPNFQALFYPVISMREPYCHVGSRNNLMGSDPAVELQEAYSSEKRVTGDTPRAFLAVSFDDHVVSVENSLQYYTALYRCKVPASLHIYPTGDHGWGIKESFPYKNEMLLEFSSWLNSF